MRLRGVHLINKLMSKKASVILRNQHSGEDSNMNAYVVFQELEAAKKALARFDGEGSYTYTYTYIYILSGFIYLFIIFLFFSFLSFYLSFFFFFEKCRERNAIS